MPFQPRPTRLQVEALEDRCLLSWGSIPPATIPLPVGAVAVALGTQGDAAITADEVDYYRFEAPVFSSFTISAATPSGSRQTVLGLYDAGGLLVASSVGSGSQVSRLLTAGTYYFGITNLEGTPGGGYTWAIDQYGDLYETNDTLATASELGTLTGRTTFSPLSLNDGADWYRFTMSAAGASAGHIAISFYHNEGDFQLELTNAVGDRLGVSDTTADAETISLNGLAAGTYYVHVYGSHEASSRARYVLEIDPYATPTPLPPLILDALGSGTAASTIQGPVADVIDFEATVTGRISVLMRADQPGMQSLLSVTSAIDVVNQAYVAAEFDEARDHLIQFDVVAGNSYQFRAGVFNDPYRQKLVTGTYRLYLSTEPLGSEVSATTPRVVPLDASGSGLQLGTLETAGDMDLFAFTTTVTGRTTVRVDGGAGLDQVVHLLTTPGQTFAVQVFDRDNRTGAYVLTITSIADDFPDGAVFPIVLDDTGAGNQKGSINYAGDVDVFRFTATQTGRMTLMMQNPAGFSLATLLSEVSVTPAVVRYDLAPSHVSRPKKPAQDRILQFDVVQGQEYTVRASGANGSSGAYQLSFAMAVDDYSGTKPHEIVLDPVGAATLSGAIAVPNDQDRFQFTAPADGYMVVEMTATQGTNMQGLLTPTFSETAFSRVDVTENGGRILITFDEFKDASGEAFLSPVALQVSAPVGWQGATRDNYLVLRIKKDQIYEFLVAAADETIGKYALALTTYPFRTEPEQPPTVRFDRVSFTIEEPGPYGISSARNWTFTLLPTSPTFSFVFDGTAPAPEVGNSPGPTNTRLAVFALPAAGTTTTTVTVPSGQAVGSTNPLIATLLIVAARDNSTPAADTAVASSVATADVLSTLLTSLIVGVTATGGDDGASTVPLIGGTVFDDLDGNGRLNEGEAGVAGETIVLEELRGGRYVIVGTTVTDAKGSYAFSDVAAGDYRVRRIAPAGPELTTPASYAVKLIGDSKPRALNFGKAVKRGQALDLRNPPDSYLAAEDVDAALGAAHAEMLGSQEWNPEDAPTNWWLGLLPLAPIVVTAMAIDQRALSAIENCRPGTTRRRGRA